MFAKFGFRVNSPLSPVGRVMFAGVLVGKFDETPAGVKSFPTIEFVKVFV